ncbi:MAG: DegT/DnrJ/EryC1/StrS family aminotransferase [Actinomycetota bacterium]|nr:DegT/DnrJ/EryC1/StrS family aminotransferase [Actinomycetota bacterium]
MAVPFLDLARLHSLIRAELDDVFDTVLAKSGFVGGSLVADFERAFADAHGRAAAAGCGSGTDAIALVLRALGIGPGDEVVVPAMTFVATAEAVLHVGATPVLADVDPETLLLTTESVAAVRTTATRAVLPVHLYGHVVPFPVLEGWRAEGLVVVEDAAQAHLASWGGRYVGEVGHGACFSFYPGKNLGALGDGGMVVSDDVGLVERIRRLRDHGRATKYEHDHVGWCSRLDGLQAAFLDVKLRHLHEWTDARRRIADSYRDEFTGFDPVRLVPWEEGAVHHLLVGRIDAARRAGFLDALRGLGIGTGIHYPVSLSKQPALLPWAQPCPEAERAAEEVFSLPMDPLMDVQDVAVVRKAVGKALGCVDD